MTLSIYRVTVKHDTGTVKLKLSATSEESVIEIVMKAEACPRSAIKNVKHLKTIW